MTFQTGKRKSYQRVDTRRDVSGMVIRRRRRRKHRTPHLRLLLLTGFVSFFLYVSCENSLFS